MPSVKPASLERVRMTPSFAPVPMAAEPHDSLIVFTRLPEPGRAKTRLIPALGAAGAADLQRRMTEHTVMRARAFTLARPRTKLTIAYEGGTAQEIQAWLGSLNFVPQGEGDLGERLQRAVTAEFGDGARSVIVIGTDCPRLDEGTLQAAFLALEESPVVFGPAKDGGYYLVGLALNAPQLFRGIPWSSPDVLSASLKRAGQAGLMSMLLGLLPDVDVPDDLADAEAALMENDAMTAGL